jgi:phosphatidylglycerol:prolipoprotein diacylglycerol transferase
MLIYAPARFALDFLRATDVATPDRRYVGLTPAQWACLATLALGVYLWTRRQPPATNEAAPPAQVG